MWTLARRAVLSRVLRMAQPITWIKPRTNAMFCDKHFIYLLLFFKALFCALFMLLMACLKPSFKQNRKFVFVVRSQRREKANKSANERLDQQWKWVRAWNKFSPLGTRMRQMIKIGAIGKYIIAPSGTSELLRRRQSRQTNSKAILQKCHKAKLLHIFYFQPLDSARKPWEDKISLVVSLHLENSIRKFSSHSSAEHLQAFVRNKARRVGSCRSRVRFKGQFISCSSGGAASQKTPSPTHNWSFSFFKSR